MQLKKLHQHQIEVDSLSSGNLSSIQPALRHLIDWYEAPEEEQNFSTLLEFINASEAREDDEEFKNPVDELFEELEQKKPEHFAVRQYKKYKLAAGDICSK